MVSTIDIYREFTEIVGSAIFENTENALIACLRQKKLPVSILKNRCYGNIPQSS